MKRGHSLYTMDIFNAVQKLCVTHEHTLRASAAAAAHQQGILTDDNQHKLSKKLICTSQGRNLSKTHIWLLSHGHVCDSGIKMRQLSPHQDKEGLLLQTTVSMKLPKCTVHCLWAATVTCDFSCSTCGKGW